MIIGLDVHKDLVYVTRMENDGKITEQYEMKNSEESWNKFVGKYILEMPEIALEASTSGKHVARILRDSGFSVHIADPKKLALIFKSSKKNDRSDSENLAKLLRLNEFPEAYLPSREYEEMRTLTRHRKYLGEEVVRIKNKVHSILSLNGIKIKATDIFGKKGLSELSKSIERLSYSEKIVINDMLKRIIDIKERSEKIENEMAKIGKDREDVNRLMTIPGINIYIATGIIGEIGDIHRFRNKESLASYAGLVPRQDQSGKNDRKGHITKEGPSMLRYLLVLAAHTVIKYSKKMKNKYLSLVRRIGKNRAIVAIARILAETIFTMLKKNVDFEDEIIPLTEKKVKKMIERANSGSGEINIQENIKLISSKGFRSLSTKPFS
jgi:transposase